jgi:alkylhydroperoxidase family enzyme
LLVEFAEAVIGGDDDWLARARSRLSERFGAEGLVDAAAVIGFFNAIDRVADATGIPLDPERLESTADFRAELGIDGFVEGRA